MKAITIDSCFNWVRKLTAARSYHDLTEAFIALLEDIDDVEKASVFEVYNNERLRDNRRHILIRKFPNDFTQQNEDTPYSFIENEYLQDISVIELENHLQAVMLSVTESRGPRRVIVIEGIFSVECLKLFESLFGIYRNQLILHDLKEHDVLTALHNRSSLDVRLLEVCEFYQKSTDERSSSSRGSWLAMLDIDYFKRINDNFGHLYGDEVLLQFGQLMDRSFRCIDYMFRFGGEEFLVIVNNVTEMEAGAILSRFRKTVEAYEFPVVGHVTVSIGAVCISQGAELPFTFLDRADKALYYAKDTGRNQLIMYEDMHDLGSVQEDGEVELF